MIDITYEPSIPEETVLLVIKQENRVNTQLVCERARFDEDQVRDGLQNLESHGWVAKVTDDLYEFVDDPRGPKDRMDPSSDPNKETQTAPIEPVADEENDEK